jgi:hypothetical protein
VLNLILVIVMALALCDAKRALTIYQKNMSLQDPFENMIYSVELCQLMGRHFWFFEIK